jgi:hypothetical protein
MGLMILPYLLADIATVCSSIRSASSCTYLPLGYSLEGGEKLKKKFILLEEVRDIITYILNIIE